MVHSHTELANIGEADAEFQQRGKFMRLVSARRDADLVDRPPEAIAETRVVMAGIGGALAGGGADEDQAQVILKLVGEFFQFGCILFPSRRFAACDGYRKGSTRPRSYPS